MLGPIWGSDSEKAFDKLSKLGSGNYKKLFAKYLDGQPIIAEAFSRLKLA